MRRQTCPTNPSDYKPISITPVLPQLAEKIVVKHWLRPALLVELLKDQFAFRPSGSTTSALVKMFPPRGLHGVIPYNCHR